MLKLTTKQIALGVVKFLVLYLLFSWILLIPEVASVILSLHETLTVALANMIYSKGIFSVLDVVEKVQFFLEDKDQTILSQDETGYNYIWLKRKLSIEYKLFMVPVAFLISLIGAVFLRPKQLFISLIKAVFIYSVFIVFCMLIQVSFIICVHDFQACTLGGAAKDFILFFVKISQLGFNMLVAVIVFVFVLPKSWVNISVEKKGKAIKKKKIKG